MSRSSTPGQALDAWAADVAIIHLRPLANRWIHTQAVAARGRQASMAVGASDRPLLVAAAWLHDLGYAPEIAKTGFHPLDGARYLDAVGAPRRLVSLVAHHSCARFEADERGMLPELRTYELEVGPVTDALIWADMTTGPTGRTVDVEERLAEILRRYTADSPVHKAIEEASANIVAAVSRVEGRLAASS